MLKENSKLKELRNIRKELIKESNDFKNELLDKIFEDLNLCYCYSYNDLYSIKGGECRRLKGFISNYNDDVINSLGKKNKLDRLNEKFYKLKNYLNNKDFGKYEVDICKLGGLNFSFYKNYWVVREENWGKNWFDYKEEMLYKEETYVIKIKWKGISMNKILNEKDGGNRIV